MSDKDLFGLKAILEAADKIKNYSSAFKSADELYQMQKELDACLMNFIVIAEMIDRLSDDIKNKYNNLEWVKIKDFRNIIAHDYFGIDAEEVWQIINHNLPEFAREIKKIIK